MSLPPSAYSALDRDHISRVPSRDGATFRLRVPRAQLLSVYLEPSVTVTVAGVPRTDGRDGLAAVKLSSSGCVLDGSPLVAALRIDERFALSFDATLTWNAAVDGGAAVRPATLTAGAETWNAAVDRRAAARPATLTADVETSVWAEPVGPFLLVPRHALAAAGDALLSRLSAVLLPRFLGLLAADYAKWSQDAAYRAARSGVDAVVSVR